MYLRVFFTVSWRIEFWCLLSPTISCNLKSSYQSTYTSSLNLVQLYQTMDPSKDKSGLDHTQDLNCNIHFVSSSLPEDLPKLDKIKQTFSGPSNNYIKTIQWNKNSNYIVKQDISLVIECWTILYLRKITSIPVPTIHTILTNKTANRNIIIMEYIPNHSLKKT